MKDYSLQQIQLRVKKIWLHEFYEFCTTRLSEKSREIMGDLLKFESDMMTIQVIENSRNYSQFLSARGREAERKKYISKVGYLYPDRSELLSNVQDFKGLLAALDATPYETMLKQVSSGDDGRNEAEISGATIDEVMLVEASRRFSMAFEDGFHYGCFYAFLKLKEQEIANITWLAELITLQVSRALPGWNKYVVPFKYHDDELKKIAE